MNKIDVNALLSTMDATIWAKAFVGQFGGDEELMFGWFANAIMTGYDHGRRSARPAVAGAVFDFAASLTTRDQAITAGAQHDAAPMADAVKEWATVREFSIEEANVKHWKQDLGL